MKKVLAMSILSFITGLFGCSSAPEQNSNNIDKKIETTQTVVETNTNTNTEEINNNKIDINYNLEDATRFKYLMSEKNMLPAYEQAAELIKNQLGVSGEISENSLRIAGWFVIVFGSTKNSNDDVEVLDGGSSSNKAYLVDLEHQLALKQNDFNSARPIIERIIKIYKDDLCSNCDSLLFRFGILVSSVGLGNNACEEDSYGKEFLAPTLTIDADKSVFTYFINVGSDSIEYKRCTLNVNASDISFSCENYK